ncbi:MAG: hypothetical protein ACP5NK_07260 [Thermoplasmata archaeon]
MMKPIMKNGNLHFPKIDHNYGHHQSDASGNGHQFSLSKPSLYIVTGSGSAPILSRNVSFRWLLGHVRVHVDPYLTALTDLHFECLKLNLKWQVGHSVCEITQDLCSFAMESTSFQITKMLFANNNESGAMRSHPAED